MFIGFDYKILQIKCFFDSCQHFRVIDAPVNIDDRAVIRTIPYDPTTRMIDVFTGIKIIVPQLFVTIGIVEFISLSASLRKRASMTDQFLVDIEERSDFCHHATLKVLGFGTNKILNTNIVQNVLYSIIGVILGVPLGLSFTYFMLNFAGDEFDMMISISPRTLIISSAITLGVSILVSFLFRRKISKLNMVEALKGVE